MQRFASSPIRDITFGEALKVSLDNYYDLLKAQVGSLKADEFLQLKLVADTIDISPKKKASEGGYTWFTYYNLLNRSDRAIQPVPISGEIQVGLESLAAVYGKFLRRLRKYVVAKILSPADEFALADIEKTIQALKGEADQLFLNDRVRWEKVAPAMGFSVGDMTAYLQWSNSHGSIRLIEEKNDLIRKATFDKKTILDKKYPTPDDKEVIDAEFDYDNPLVRLRYPIWPDYTYPNGDFFSPTYLAQLGLGSTGLFDDRYVASFDKTLETIKGAGSGKFAGELDKSTTTSSSITTDWGASASGGYYFIHANASTSEHQQIQEDFKKGQKLKLGAESATRINIGFPAWFKPNLFTHQHVLKNPKDFDEFFGLKGSLLYYPTALIVIRGFRAEFTSSQAWTYDYEKRFNASGGGGFNCCGISFGGSASYSSTVKEHQVDRSGTTLTFSDDVETIRFVGYAVKKNDVLSKAITVSMGALGTNIGKL